MVWSKLLKGWIHIEPSNGNEVHDIRVSMLWFKFSFGAKFLKLVQFFFLMYSLPLSGTMVSKIETS